MKIDEEMVQRAHELAKEAHAKDVRKFDNEPYIRHPERIVEGLKNYHHKHCGQEKTALTEFCYMLFTVGYLHDVMEDHPDFTQRVRDGFPDEVFTALKLLTRKEGETYFDFIMRIMQGTALGMAGELAIRVKLADLEDNLRNLQEGSMKDKYRFAQFILQRPRIGL